MSKTFKIVKGDMSDGYHTFDELYEHRCLLFIQLCLMQPESSAWRLDYEGWFCLYTYMPKGQISYHCPVKYLDLVKEKIQMKNDIIFDGHTSADVIKRLS